MQHAQIHKGSDFSEDVPEFAAEFQRPRQVGRRCSRVPCPGLGQILTDYGALQCLTGDYQAASANLTRAIELNRGLGYPLGEAQALNTAGELSLESARLSDARAKHEKAREIAIAMQSRPEEARALEGIGRCHLRNGRRAESTESLRQALDIYENIGSSSAGRVRRTLDDHES